MRLRLPSASPGPIPRPHAASLLGLTLLAAGTGEAAGWRALAEDALHDPEGPAIDLLQQPAEALSRLPADGAGNRVDWVEALREGHIEPRGSLAGDGARAEVLELDVIMRGDGSSSMPYVRFPHEPHTRWLDCRSCHDALFEKEAGATPVSMLAILDGEYCGRCHGAVSFPLTECARCHSVDPDTVVAEPR